MPDETQLFDFVVAVQAFNSPFLEQVDERKVVMRIYVPPFGFTWDESHDEMVVGLPPFFGELSPVFVGEL